MKQETVPINTLIWLSFLNFPWRVWGRKNIEHVVGGERNPFVLKLISLAFIWHFQLWEEFWAVPLPGLVITEKGSTRVMLGMFGSEFMISGGSLTRVESGMPWQQLNVWQAWHSTPSASRTANKAGEVWNTIQFELFQLNSCDVRETSFNLREGLQTTSVCV